MTTRTRDNIIGREIYERIKDLTNPQRIEYFKTVSTEYKELYKKYNNTIRQQRYKQDEAKKATANEKAKQGMKVLRETRTPEEQKQYLQLRKTYDKKYEVKRKMTREEASSVIQRQYRKYNQEQEQKKKQDAQSIATNILNDIIQNSFNKKIVNGELKAKRGRRIGQVAKK